MERSLSFSIAGPSHRGCGNGLKGILPKGNNTNLKRASVVAGPVGTVCESRGTAYNVGLSLMPPDPHICHISFLNTKASVQPNTIQPHPDPPPHPLSRLGTSAVGGVAGGVTDGVLALSSCVFSGQEQLLKCYPNTVFHNWLSCPMFYFTVACDLDFNSEPIYPFRNEHDTLSEWVWTESLHTTRPHH